MSKTDDFLVEIGTEELPPKALRSLMEAFGANLTAGIDDARLAHGEVHCYASPRRLAIVVDKLSSSQEDRDVEQKGPPVKVAFDADGNPTPAATAFATKCGTKIDALDPAYAPGTGTPVPGGLTSNQALEIVRGLSGIQFVGMDVVEVAPDYDHSEITALLAAQLALEYICLQAAVVV